MSAGALVTSADELGTVTEQARAAGRVGIDTEFMRERTYSARLCLVQMAFSDSAPVLIDATRDLNLQPMGDLIADPEVQIVVHSGKQDLEIFHDLFGSLPTRIFDVQIAAGFVGLGASLPYGRLVQAALGVSLKKGEAYTDWCRRPLTREQQRYAADDVRYLIPIAEHLERKLDELGRRGWIEQEMSSLEDPDAYANDPGEAWKRVPGRGTLSRSQLTVLKEVAAWREETARTRDLPRGWVVKDATLVEIARRAPTSLPRLRDVRGLNAKEVERSGRDLLAAIENGRNAESIELPEAPPRSAQVRARMLVGLADALLRSRCHAAEIATELVATRAELELLLAQVVSRRLDESRHRLLHGWRRELAGDALIALAEGRIAIRASVTAPYVEEVDL